MKRRFIPGLMLAAALTLTNCSEQLVSPEKENDIIIDETVQTPSDEDGERTPYVVYADIPVTKTIANGNGTYWAEGDKVTIYTKGEALCCQGEYTYAGNKTFTGTAGTLSAVNDWYCIYPYKTSTAGSVTQIQETVTIGAAASNYIQTQTTVNSMTHIAGQNVPMYGIVKQVSGETTPTFSMSHLPALVAVKIVNGTGTPITIEQIGLETAASKIVGNFTLGFNGDVPTLASVDASSSKKAVLNMVNGGDAVQANSEGLFYLAVAPVNDKFTIYVNGTSIANDVAIPLESGKMTTMRVTIPELKGTVSSNTKKGDKDFITWPENTTTTLASVNGSKAIIHTVPSDGVVTITGTLGEFLGATADESILPISFYSASPIIKQSTGVLQGTESQLSINTISVDAYGIITKTITASDISKKFNFPISFSLTPIGTFSDLNSLILLEETASHKYLSESKANGLLAQALKDAGVTFVIDDIRKALYEGNVESWKQIVDLAKNFAPGQFSVEDGGSATSTSVLGTVLLMMVDTKTTEAQRQTYGEIFMGATITVTLKASGKIAFWGMNIQSQDADVQ